MNKQKLALTIFFVGGSIFLASLGQFISEHSTWSEMTNPREVGHLMLITGTGLATLAGALGINTNKKDDDE